MKAGYVRNLVRHPRVRVKLREGLGAQWHTGTAHVPSNDDPRERQRWLAGRLPSSAANAAAVRLFGTDGTIDLGDLSVSIAPGATFRLKHSTCKAR
jgi:hypothetical protein